MVIKIFFIFMLINNSFQRTQLWKFLIHAEYFGQNNKIKLWFAIKDDNHGCLINQQDYQTIVFQYQGKKTLNIHYDDYFKLHEVAKVDVELLDNQKVNWELQENDYLKGMLAGPNFNTSYYYAIYPKGQNKMFTISNDEYEKTIVDKKYCQILASKMDEDNIKIEISKMHPDFYQNNLIV